MRVFRITVMAVLMLVFAGILLSCDSNVEGESGQAWALNYDEVTLPNGRVIPCIIYSGYNRGGLSCDWGER